VTRLLGVDLGEKRIGLAVADRDGGRAIPLATLRRSPSTAADAEALARVAAVQDVDELVVGLPLHANGEAGAQAAATRAWTDAVGPILGLPVTFRDERLTSHLAEQRVGPMKRGRSGGPPTRAQRDAYRARIDREAAAIILQDELDARASRAGESDEAGKHGPRPRPADHATETPR
jgi:putative pre-16S rRNA nuclease